MIRDFTPDDIIFIEQIGSTLNKDYKFKINPFTRCLVYEKDEKVVGFIVFSLIYEKAEIIDVATMEDYQGQGVGSQLLSSVFEECRLKRCESVTLEVRASNQKAIAFYKKHGFREISIRKSYYNDGENALVMIKMVM